MSKLTKDRALAQLQERARAWGGDIVEAHDYTFMCLEDRGWIQRAPFIDWCIGVRHRRREVVIAPWLEPKFTHDYVTALIHEMGHVFASKVPPNKMIHGAGSDEFSFLGWECQIADELGLSFRDFCHGNRNYVVGNDGENLGWFSKNNPDELRRIFRDRGRVAKDLGLIVDGRAVSIR